MRSGEHGDVGKIFHHVPKELRHTTHGWEQHLISCGLEHERMAAIVDVFTGQGKVHPLLCIEKGLSVIP